MTIEVANYISALNATYPENAADRASADNHLRLIKACVKNSFPYITAPVTVTHANLNKLAGVTDILATTLARHSLSISSLNALIAVPLTSGSYTVVADEDPYPTSSVSLITWAIPANAKRISVQAFGGWLGGGASSLDVDTSPSAISEMYRTVRAFGGSSTVTVYSGFFILASDIGASDVTGLQINLILMDETTNTWVGAYTVRDENEQMYGTARLSLGPGNTLSQIKLQSTYCFVTVQANVLTD